LGELGKWKNHHDCLEWAVQSEITLAMVLHACFHLYINKQ
jgi:hypothetical protein